MKIFISLITVLFTWCSSVSAQHFDDITTYDKNLFDSISTFKIKTITGRGCYLIVFYDSFDTKTKKLNGQSHAVYDLNEYDLEKRRSNSFGGLLNFESVMFSQNSLAEKIDIESKQEVLKTLPEGTKFYSAKDLKLQRTKLLSHFLITRSRGLNSFYVNFEFDKNEATYTVPFQITLFVKKEKVADVISKMTEHKAKHCV